MLSATVVEGLKSYSIGEKLRALRLRKKLGLVELGRHTGLSPALLSKIERSRLFPTLPTLIRIAMVFNVGLDYFFVDDRKRNVVALARRKDRQRFPEKPGTPDVAFWFESLDFGAVERRVNSYLAEFSDVPAAKNPGHQHSGAEMVYVLKGRLSLTVRGEEYLLDAGDAVYFDSSVPHRYSKIGKTVCKAVVVTSS